MFSICFRHSKTNIISSHRHVITSISRVKVTHMSKFKPGTVEKIHHQLHRSSVENKARTLEMLLPCTKGSGVYKNADFISSDRRVISSISRVEIILMSKFKPGTVEKLIINYIGPPSKIKPAL